LFHFANREFANVLLVCGQFLLNATKLLLDLLFVNLFSLVNAARNLGFKLLDILKSVFEVLNYAEIAVHLETFLLELFIHPSKEFFVCFLFLWQRLRTVA